MVVVSCVKSWKERGGRKRLSMRENDKAKGRKGGNQKRNPQRN